ncbi:MAG: ABC transporter ATP-binding protein [Erysipelotrichaceae bacterium]|nr:ABC transporter ATP-binding protein [Erysipelotrichaceae bacterium]
MENMENAIEIRDMTKYFKVHNEKMHTLKERILYFGRGQAEIHRVLNHIDLDIKKGETVALIGTNGSGKSTLLKLMTKIIYPNEGTVETNGKLTSLLELGAGFHIEFSGRENIYFNASIFGLTRKEIDERIDEIIEFSELEDFIDQPIRTYSSGMYMRLAFSVAINVDADILLIDEILAVGDQHFQDKCYAKLRELRDSGKTIVIVSHSLGVVQELCRRAIWIYHGDFKLDGAPSYVIEEYLKQIALDNQKRTAKNKTLGTHKNQGVLYIDTPVESSIYRRSEKTKIFNGWMVTDSAMARLRISLDGKELEGITRHRREDVYRAYYEQYAGFLDVDTLGWEKVIDLTQLDKGEHQLKAECMEPNGTVLYSMVSIFSVID